MARNRRTSQCAREEDERIADECLRLLADGGARLIEIAIVADRATIRSRRHGALAYRQTLDHGGWQLAERMTQAGPVIAIGNDRYACLTVGRAPEEIYFLERIDRVEAIEVATLPGIPAAIRSLLDAAIDARSGLVVAAGPANSGKRAILRAVGAAIDARARSLWVIAADPVEPFADVRQIVVDAGMPRGEALRIAMAARPDIVILDRIDTPDAARAAIEHARERLVFAAVDCPDAVGAIAALRGLRVDRFDLAASLRAIVARRPADRLCPACARPVQASGSVSALLGFDRGAVVHVADGCEVCKGTGAAGVIGVFEAIAVDPDLRRLIDGGGDSAILARHAFLRSPDLGSAARTLVREGVIAAEEAVRLSRSVRLDLPVAARAELSLWDGA